MSDQTRQGVHPPVGSGREQYRGNPAAPSSPDTLTVTLKEAFDSFFEDVELLGRAFAKNDVDLLKAAAASVSQRSVSFRVRLLAALPSAPDHRLREALQRLVDHGPQWSPHPDIRDRVPRDPEWGASLIAVADIRAVLSEATPDPALDVDAARQAAEAALPDGWVIRDGHPWRDHDYRDRPVWRVAAGPPDRFGSGGTGPTPAAALDDLIVRLSASQPPEPDIQ